MNVWLRHLGFLVAGFLLGHSLVPVAAQSQSQSDPQFVVRSDGAAYMVTGGQRRWIATVVMSDDEINAIPEGEPIYAGLSLGGSSKSSEASFKTDSKDSKDKKDSKSSSQSSTTDDDDDEEEDDDGSSGDLGIKFEEAPDSAKRGESFDVVIKTKKNASCEFKVRFANGEEDEYEDVEADKNGECAYEVEIDDDAKEGDARLIVKVRDGGKKDEAQHKFKVKK